MPTVQSEAALRKAAGVASWEFLHCEDCVASSLATTYQFHEKYTWAIELCCQDVHLHKKWYICKECIGTRKRMFQTSQLSRHNKMYHNTDESIKKRKVTSIVLLSESKRSCTEISEEHDKEDDVDVNNDDNISTSSHDAGLLEEASVSFVFSREESSRYFRHQFNGLGAAYLIGYSCFEQSNVSTFLDSEEVNLQLKISSLVSFMTRTDRLELGEIFRMIQAKQIRDTSLDSTFMTMECNDKRKHGSESNPLLWSIDLPATPQELRHRELEGKYAILPNLPRPPVRRLKNHAYTPLKDIIADFLGHGIPFEKVIMTHQQGAPVTRIGESARAKTIYDNAQNLYRNENFVCLMIQEWQDDFQVLKSNKGQRDGTSVWIKTISFIPPHGIKKNSVRNTYLVAVGAKGIDHKEVELMFKDELDSIKSGSNAMYYCGASRKMVHAYCDVFLTVMDQPERRRTNYVGLGNSQFHSRFGYCLDVSAVKNALSPCSGCFDMLMHTLLGDHSTSAFYNTDCADCSCWRTYNHPLMDSPPPKKFPEEYIPDNGKLTSGPISYQSLRQTVDIVHKEIVSGSWTPEVARLFMRSQCLNGNAMDKIIELALNCLNLRLLTENKDEEPEAYIDIMKEKESQPEMFLQWSFPSFWTRGHELSHNFEAPMHLFSGITKAIVRSIQNWAALRGSRSSFLDYASNLLDPIQELELTWCKCLLYTGGKLAGWVSENYNAMARVSAWFYSGLGNIAPDPLFQEPIHLPQKRWLKKDNHGWLKARNLDCTGSAEELRNRVAAFMTQPDGPSSITGPTGGPVEGVSKMIVMLYKMMSLLMANSFSESDIKNVDRAIRMFLSRFHYYDNLIQSTGDDNDNLIPTWITSYNCMCLLNLPHIIEKFGPVRNFWEGGYVGEGYLRVMKPNLSHGLRGNWMMNILTKMLNQNAFAIVCDKQEQGHLNDHYRNSHISANENLKLMAHEYKNMGQVLRFFTNGIPPLSIIILQTGLFGILLPKGQMLRLFREGFVKHFHGMNYHKWHLDITCIPEKGITLQSIEHYCILLPEIKPDGSGNYC